MSRYIYNYNDLAEKRNLLSKQHRYPAYSQFVSLDNTFLASNTFNENMFNIFKYTSKENKVTEEKIYLNFTSKEDTLKDNVSSRELIQIKKNLYDTKGNLIQQQFFPGNKEELGTLTIMETETSYCEDTRLDYSYDSQNRLTKVVLTSCGDVVESEEYTYHPKKGYITTLKRYIVNPTYSKYSANNMVATYNEHGDITEMHMILKNDTKPPRTKIGLDPVHRYYEYEYDKHNNWVKCKLYLMETKDQPTAIAQRIIEYYQ